MALSIRVKTAEKIIFANIPASEATGTALHRRVREDLGGRGGALKLIFAGRIIPDSAEMLPDPLRAQNGDGNDALRATVLALFSAGELPAQAAPFAVRQAALYERCRHGVAAWTGSLLSSSAWYIAKDFVVSMYSDEVPANFR